MQGAARSINLLQAECEALLPPDCLNLKVWLLTGQATCLWRMLAPSGRMMVIVPNRRGVWTRTDNTPFGHGRPYSRPQITQLLRQTWFTPTSWGEALFMPPFAGGWFLRSAMAWERVGAALSLPFAGVHIVEATKQVYRAIPAHRERTRLIPALEPVLVPSSLQRDDVPLRR